MTTLKNDDVIGTPGQNLSELELDVLVAMANGNPLNAIQTATHTDSATLRMVEMQVRAKLGAKTPGHMVARGFILGVLLPRALCALLATSCAVANDHNSNRNRTPTRSRIPASLTRLTRATSNGRSGRSGDIEQTSAGHLFSLQIAHSFSAIA
jgi:hypothetical protein